MMIGHFQGEIIAKMQKYAAIFLKFFFSRTTGPISIKLGRKHPCVTGIQNYTNNDDRPFPRGDNSEMYKYNDIFLKIFFSRTTGPISFKLGTSHPQVTEFQICTSKGPSLLQRGDNHKNAQIRWGLMGPQLGIKCRFHFIYIWVVTQVSDVAHGPLVQCIFTFLQLSPLEMTNVHHLNKLESPSPKDASYQIWLKLAEWFWRRFLNDHTQFSHF